MRAVLGSLICFWMGLAGVAAQDLPQLYDVTGVTADDVLNIRAAPDADAPILGTLGHDARGVEVVAANAGGTWGQVNTGEGAGWVSMRFMAARGVVIDNFNLPVGLSCFGTEPFWALDADEDALRFHTPEIPARDLALWVAQDSGVPGDLRRMIRFAGPEGPAVAYIHPADCNDGMSDRAYGLRVAVMLGLDSSLLTGCCSLSR